MDDSNVCSNARLQAVIDQVPSPTAAELDLARRRLAYGMPSHLVVAEIASMRAAETNVEDLLARLRDIVAELPDEEFRLAVRDVRAGKEVGAAVAVLRAYVEDRRKRKGQSRIE